MAVTEQEVELLVDEVAVTVGTSEDEWLEMHEVLRNAMRRLGVKGAALDEATCAAVQSAQRAILKDRFASWKRRRRIRVIKNGA